MNKNRLPDYWELPNLSAGYSHLGGMYLRVTKPFATILALRASNPLIATNHLQIATNYSLPFVFEFVGICGLLVRSTRMIKDKGLMMKNNVLN